MTGLARFSVQEVPIGNLILVNRLQIGDHRGYLERMFCQQELGLFLSGKNIVQINHTLTAKKGTVRGMHFQHPPHCETKMVSCIRGMVFDVAVDLRRGSPTFLRWHGEILSAEKHNSLIIPEGFAHGFQTLVDDCEMLYFHTAAYQPAAEAGLQPLDQRVAIGWPLPIAELSAKDAAQALLTDDFRGI